jgi:hypothetical protein
VTFFHSVGDTLRRQFELIPLSVARGIFLAVFVILIFWIVQLPATQTTPSGRQSKWYQDLRIWAWLTLIFQVVIYAVF